MGVPMDGLILAAGEGSRLGEQAAGIPKLFVEVAGRTLYERQLDTLAEICDHVTIVLGHGFLGADEDPPPKPDASPFDREIHVCANDSPGAMPPIKETKIRRYLASDHDIDRTAIVVPHWAEVDNAESCRLGLRECDDGVLLLNGDILVRDAVVRGMVKKYQHDLRPAEQSAVAVIPGLQDDMTAVRWDDSGTITDYGAIVGHQVAGVFVIHEDHIADAREVLEAHQEDWFPCMFPALDTTYFPVSRERVYEINTPRHLVAAREAVKEWNTESPTESEPVTSE